MRYAYSDGVVRLVDESGTHIPDLKVVGVKRDKRQPNYMKIGKNHIFMNFIPVNLPYVPDLMSLDEAHRIHIFITTLKHNVDTLSYLLRELYSVNRRKRVIIHVPAYISDVAKVLDYELKFVEEECNGIMDMQPYGDHHQIFTEIKGPVFVIPGSSASVRNMIEFKYTSSGIDICMHNGSGIKYDKYELPNMCTNDKEVDPNVRFKQCVFQNRVMEEYPDVFKDRIISLYKEYAPLYMDKRAILEKDDEIWYWIYAKSDWHINTHNMTMVFNFVPYRGGKRTNDLNHIPNLQFLESNVIINKSNM